MAPAATKSPPSIGVALQQGMLELLRRDPPPEPFVEAWLRCLVRCTGAVAGRVRKPAADGTLAVAADVGLAERCNVLEEAKSAAALPRSYEKLLLESYTTGRTRLAPRSALADLGPDDTIGTMVIAPLAIDGELCGTVELALPPDAAPDHRRDAVQAVQQAGAALADDRRRRQARALQAKQLLVDEVEQFTRAVHEKLDLRHTAYVVANDGRRLIGCDRVSVLIRRGTRFDLLAVSGADVIETRSQAAKLLASLTTAACRTGETVHFRGAATDLAPQLREAFGVYADAAHVKEAIVVPLFAEPPKKAEPAATPSTARPIGALVIEQLNDATPQAGRDERIWLAALHASSALAKARDFEAIPLLSLWRCLGEAKQLFAPGTRLKTFAVLTLVLCAAAALKFVPATLALSARGVLQPVHRHHVFAPLDGVVKQIHVRHGDRVEAGQLLAEMRNTDLDVALADAVGQRTSAYEQVLAVERALYEDTARINVDERHRLAGQRSELKQRIVTLDEELRLLRRKREQLRIVSPIAGEITTWDVETLLRNRPVRQGQVLVDVADTTGPWELELEIPEDGIGHVLAAQEVQGPALEVHYRAAADPRTDRRASLAEVRYAAEIRGEEGNVVSARAVLAEGDVPTLRPGAEATAKVYCGRRSIGYVWLHDAVDFVRTKVLFRMY